MQDIHSYGADKEEILHARYGDVFLVAKEQKLVTPIKTMIGSFCYLSYKGRAALGFSSLHKPPPWMVETHYYRRRVMRLLEAKGYVCLGYFSRNILHYQQGNKTYFVVAKHDGYTARGVRRLMTKLRPQLTQGDSLVVATPYPNQLKRLATRHEYLSIIALRHTS